MFSAFYAIQPLVDLVDLLLQCRVAGFHFAGRQQASNQLIEAGNIEFGAAQPVNHYLDGFGVATNVGAVRRCAVANRI